MGFPHVLQLARLDRIRELKGGQQEVETVWVITSLSSEQASAARLLELARQYWSIENGLHYRLDVSAAEDRCRGAPPGGRHRVGHHAPSHTRRVSGLGTPPTPGARQHLSGLQRKDEPPP
jgi:hypothetical protein